MTDRKRFTINSFVDADNDAIYQQLLEKTQGFINEVVPLLSQTNGQITFAVSTTTTEDQAQ
jgi:hypothetical protein